MELSKVLEKELLEGRFWTHSKTLVEGCTKVSPGCLNCWSEAMQMRFNGGKPFDGRVVVHADRIFDILPKSKNRDPRVWTYWNDIFHGDVSETLQNTLFRTLKGSYDYHIICTKRPENAAHLLLPQCTTDRLPLKNVMIMVTMEDQAQLCQRGESAYHLSEMGWNVGILVEPMLTPVDISQLMFLPSWIICGPENGKGKRPFDGAWAMRLQAQAQERGIPFFYKPGLLNGKRYIETP